MHGTDCVPAALTCASFKQTSHNTPDIAEPHNACACNRQLLRACARCLLRMACLFNIKSTWQSMHSVICAVVTGARFASVPTQNMASIAANACKQVKSHVDHRTTQQAVCARNKFRVALHNVLQSSNMPQPPAVRLHTWSRDTHTGGLRCICQAQQWTATTYPLLPLQKFRRRLSLSIQDI